MLRKGAAGTRYAETKSVDIFGSPGCSGIRIPSQTSIPASSGGTYSKNSGGNTTAYTYNTIPATGKPAAPVVLSIADVDQYATMVSFLPSEGSMDNKHRTEGAVLYFDYPLGKDDIYPDYKNNRGRDQ